MRVAGSLVSAAPLDRIEGRGQIGQTSRPRGFFPLLNGGEAEVFYCFAFLYLAFAGAGPWSIDQLWRRKRSASERA
jgi:hypothetical protein